jgi:hypothetical protein
MAVDFRGDADERFRQVLEPCAVQMLAQPRVELHAAEKPATAKGDVEQPEYAPPGKAAGELFQLVQLAGKIAAAHQRADRCPRDHGDLDTGFVQGAQNADMRPAARASATERQSYTFSRGRQGIDRTRCRGESVSLLNMWPAAQ